MIKKIVAENEGGNEYQKSKSCLCILSYLTKWNAFACEANVSKLQTKHIGEALIAIHRNFS
jgi:hypothetical protein